MKCLEEDREPEKRAYVRPPTYPVTGRIDRKEYHHP
jgi:hypothetical protein